MTRSFSYEVVENGYKIWIDNVLTIVQTGFMPYPDTTHEVDTPEYYAGCAENDIAQMQAEDLAQANQITDAQMIQEQINENKTDLLNAMLAITELYESIL
jgi:hypothetical protein